MAAVIQNVMVMSGVSSRLMAKNPTLVVTTRAAMTAWSRLPKNRRAKRKTKKTTPSEERAEGSRAAHSFCPKTLKLEAVSQ